MHWFFTLFSKYFFVLSLADLPIHKKTAQMDFSILSLFSLRNYYGIEMNWKKEMQKLKQLYALPTSFFDTYFVSAIYLTKVK